MTAFQIARLVLFAFVVLIAIPFALGVVWTIIRDFRLVWRARQCKHENVAIEGEPGKPTAVRCRDCGLRVERPK